MALFAATVAHEIRTPLAAAAGEVELALRRERPAEEYRAALRRIGAELAELVEISGDLALLGVGDDIAQPPASTAQLDRMLITVGARYAGRDGVVLPSSCGAARIAGDEAQVGRAIALVLDHAMRHRCGDAIVRVGVEQSAAGVHVRIDAQPPGLWPRAWNALRNEAPGSDTPLRLRTARRLLDLNDGTLVLCGDATGEYVRIELLRA